MRSSEDAHGALVQHDFRLLLRLEFLERVHGYALPWNVEVLHLLPILVELLDHNVHVHVVVIWARHVHHGFGLGVVADRRLRLWCSSGDERLFRAKKELLVLRSRRREILLHDILNRLGSFLAKPQQRHPHLGRLFPSVVDALEVPVKERKQLILGLRVSPKVKPLLPRMPSQPLFLRLHLQPGSDGTHTVHRVRPRARDIRWHVNPLHIWPLVVPPGISKRVPRVHLAKAFDPPAAFQHVLNDELVKQVASVHASPRELLAVQVSAPFPRRNGLQGRRSQRRDEPLRDGEVRVSCESDAAAAPGHRRHGPDGIIPVLGFLAAHDDHWRVLVAAVKGTARVDVDDGVAARNPVRWVRRLELFQAGERARRDAEVPWRHVAQRRETVELLAKG
ncbi:hypothetical protein CaCOL14_000388 [Colletotrichum acutatum]